MAKTSVQQPWPLFLGPELSLLQDTHTALTAQCWGAVELSLLCLVRLGAELGPHLNQTTA